MNVCHTYLHRTTEKESQLKQQPPCRWWVRLKQSFVGSKVLVPQWLSLPRNSTSDMMRWSKIFFENYSVPIVNDRPLESIAKIGLAYLAYKPVQTAQNPLSNTKQHSKQLSFQGIHHQGSPYWWDGEKRLLETKFLDDLPFQQKQNCLTWNQREPNIQIPNNSMSHFQGIAKFAMQKKRESDTMWSYL